MARVNTLGTTAVGELQVAAAAGLEAWKELNGQGTLQDREQIIRMVAGYACSLATKQVTHGEHVHYLVAKTQATLARPSPDFICRLNVKRSAYEANTFNGEDIIAYDVARAAMRILEDQYPLVVATALVVGRRLYVTSVQHSDEMAERGLKQCRGCGSFFATSHKGLYMHQHESAALACIEAGIAREAAEAKGHEELQEQDPGMFVCAYYQAMRRPRLKPRKLAGTERKRKERFSSACLDHHLFSHTAACGMTNPSFFSCTHILQRSSPG